jgi:glycosyltransferase involved in cell wall biosynthesis
MMSYVVVIIPALNEEDSIGQVLIDIPRGMVDEIVVVDNGSTDGTGRIARSIGAKVVVEPERGYGSACLAGIKYVKKKYRSGSTIVVFLDGDYSDHPEEMVRILRPIRKHGYDMVIGTRRDLEKDAIAVHVRLLNIIFCKFLSIILKKKINDLGPFRAIRLSALRKIDMQERTFGWTTEMGVKAVRMGIKWKEVPVSYRKRLGYAKISGDLGSGLRAVLSMIKTALRYQLRTY